MEMGYKLGKLDRIRGRMNSLKINNIEIGASNKKVFVIAEIGNNHNGDINRALKMIDQAKEIGVDCVKFQMRDLTNVYREKSLNKSGDDLSAEYTIDLLKRFELTPEEHKKVRDYCNEKKLFYMCTPWDSSSISILEEFEVEAYKVASADFTNLPLIDDLIKTQKPLILSTGMSTQEEIEKVTQFLKNKKAQFALLHCNSTYPAPFHGINLNYIQELQKIHSIIGYSGHERGIAVSLGAVGLGAKVIERHFTLDRNMEGPDHAASLEFKEFKELVDGIRELELALGEKGKRIVSQGEMMNRETLAKSLISSKQLKKGHTLTREDIDIKSPGQGVSPLFLDKLIGKKLSRDMNKEDYFFKSDIIGGQSSARKYEFSRPWGIPVRYYDFSLFAENLKSDLIEFHLSYSDMDLKLSDFFDTTYDFDFVVHAPELFKDSKLMDLASEDQEYREFSKKETQRVIQITRDLKKYFPKTSKPQIVANIGGFTMDKNLTEGQKEACYDRFFKSLSELDTEGVEIIPQTMAPFPWHFGGQRYQNLFVHPEEIAKKCKENKIRICLDVSHSVLTSNTYDYDFLNFIETVGPYVAHLHISDSKGVDGEGLQIHEGDINFKDVGDALKKFCPNASFIPEVWQGHKNNGEGFWFALEKLEGLI